jgi:hypothetical protein
MKPDPAMEMHPHNYGYSMVHYAPESLLKSELDNLLSACPPSTHEAASQLLILGNDSQSMEEFFKSSEISQSLYFEVLEATSKVSRNQRRAVILHTLITSRHFKHAKWCKNGIDVKIKNKEHLINTLTALFAKLGFPKVSRQSVSVWMRKGLRLKHKKGVDSSTYRVISSSFRKDSPASQIRSPYKL